MIKFRDFFREKSQRPIKRLLPLLLLFVLSTQMSWGQATLPMYDGLNYTTGTQLSAASGWYGNSVGATPDLPITAGSLSYSGILSPIGNKVAFGGGGDDVTKAFTTTTTGTVYYSHLINITSLTGFTSGGYIVGLINSASNTVAAPGSASIGATVWYRQSATSGKATTHFNIGFSSRANATPVYGTVDYPINTPVLVVCSYQIITGTANDITKFSRLSNVGHIL